MCGRFALVLASRPISLHRPHGISVAARSGAVTAANTAKLQLPIPNLRDPTPGPFHCFQFEVTEATGEEDQPLDASTPEPIQAQLALVPYQVERHRLLPAVIP